MEHFDIKVEPKAIDNRMVDPDLKNAFRHFSETASQSIQKKIKQNIAGLLREKGVPPQEVKSFLETLSVGYTRSILKGMNASMIEPSDLLNRVVIRSQPEWHREGWQERIIAILKNEHLLNTKDLDKNWFQEGKPVQLNLEELLKQGKQKRETIFFHTNQAMKNRQPQEMEANQEKGFESQSGKKDDPMGGSFVKEASKHSIAMPRIDKSPLEMGLANQARNSNTLPHPLPKILDRMIWMIQAGEQRGRISISPPELGRIDLHLVIKQGHLQANLSTESLLVKGLIEENLNQLRQQLTDQGLVVDKFEVTVGLDNRQFREGEMWTAGGRKGSSFAKKSEADEDTPKRETEQIRPSIDNPYQIDVHV
ncbi:MAG: flagellar hook-length control protein FliK [Deltaproteobacteria bacterium]|nr:flagellar hook-length control protein FliK [Deltaproteobacteria bacterium]